VTREIGKHQQGEFLCKECRVNPERLLQHLLELASQGNQSLKALQGYSQREQLGKGGMGAVYLVQNNQTGEQVALKLMLPQIAVGEQAKAQFQREAENTRALKHRHVVELRETGCVNGIFFFTLEYCEGRSVGEMIKERGGMLPVGEACKLIIQALEGLQYSHTAAIPYIKRQDGTYAPGHGLVHRDIKPANLFLVRGGKSHIVKIGDYGLAKAFELAGLSGQTRTGDVSGTPAFMTREQVTNFRYAKPEVDVWAMAASLYFMVTGMIPRDFPRGRDPWLTVLETNAVPILQRNAAIPKRLAEVIDYALVDNPQIGFKTAIEFKQALESVL
jgi:serine/threonine protein kinase